MQSRELIIANTGQVPVTFEFIKKLDDSSYCKDWLNIEPYSGFIMPGMLHFSLIISSSILLTMVKYNFSFLYDVY